MFRRGVIFAALSGILGLPAASCLGAQDDLKSLAAVHAISNATAAQGLPVLFEATVTYYERGNIDLFVQEGDEAIYVETTQDQQFAPGDRVLVDGITRASFRPEILSRHVTLLHHGTPPAPVQADFTQLIRAELDCRVARVRAVVRAANIFTDGPRKSLLLDLLMPGGLIQAQVADEVKSSDLLPLLDSTIEITGAVAGKFDNKNQMTGVMLEVPSFSDVHIVERAPRGPHQLVPRKFDEILHNLHVQDQTERVRVQGTITYYQQGAAMVLQDQENALWVDTLTEEPHAIGDHVLVSGFPDVRNGSVVLTGAEIEDTHSNSPLRPAQLDAVQLASGAHPFELVSGEGELIMQVREAAQDQYVIASGGHVFSAIYRHPERGLDLPLGPMRDVRLGSRIRVAGICVLDKGDQFRGQVAFHILLRSSDDIAVLAGPSLISVQNLLILLGLLVIVVLIVIVKAFLLERRMRRQDVANASAIERWRTRVIDGINDAIPLRETMLQITELLSFKLHVDYCWADVAFEGTFGTRPADSERAGLKVFEQEIPARSGAALGKICVAFKTPRLNSQIGPEAFENAARLAALAIETGGRYSELVRRSELDPLTNAQNRFSFDRALDESIERQKKSGGKLGLVFIDLDEFKLVNDEFGHVIGDRYLREVALRLGSQLRTSDLLGRLGGDEFAVLVSDVKSHEEVTEIAHRLQSCFDDPFVLDGTVISGAASAGCALFPDDASSQAALMESADASMYRAKRQKVQERARVSVDADYGDR